jgi:hypothetical protein
VPRKLHNRRKNLPSLHYTVSLYPKPLSILSFTSDSKEEIKSSLLPITSYPLLTTFTHITTTYPPSGAWKIIGLWGVEDSAITDGDEVVNLTHWPRFTPLGRFLILIPVRGWINPTTMVRPEGLGKSKIFQFYHLETNAKPIKIVTNKYISSSLIPKSHNMPWTY